MTDRLEELLAEGPPGDADVTGLAGIVRSRRSARRRATGVVVGTVVAVAAVPVVFALTGSVPDTSPAPAGQTSAAADPSPDDGVDPAPAGRRVESWRDLTATVPDDWGYGGGTDWCADPRDEQGPEVVRTGGAVRAIGCTPQSGYGLYFGDASAINLVHDSGHVWQYGWDSRNQVKAYPEDAWLGIFRHGDHYVMVVTPEEALTREVLDTVRVVEGRDPHGCTPRDGEDAALGDGDRLSVCRYGADGWLEESRLLSGDDSEAFRAAVAAAPLKGDAEPCAPGSDPEQPGQTRVGAGGDLGSATVVFESWCPSENGIHLSGVSRDLTEDVMRWVLTPGWSGALDGSVPVPSEPGSDR